MPADLTGKPPRASELLGRVVRDTDGKAIGRVADLHTARDEAGRERITAAIVTSGRWGRLLGYERDEVTGPWLLEKLAHRIIRRHTRHVLFGDLRF
jgi:sporulation protein YlmC with PRC-barrel domain